MILHENSLPAESLGTRAKILTESDTAWYGYSLISIR